MVSVEEPLTALIGTSKFIIVNGVSFRYEQNFFLQCCELNDSKLETERIDILGVENS